MNKYWIRSQVITQNQRPIKAKTFLVLTKSAINPGFENEIGESSSEGNARKIVDALNLREPQEDRIRELEIALRAIVQAWRTKPSSFFPDPNERKIELLRPEIEKAIAILDK